MTYTSAGKKVMLDALGGTNPALSVTHVGAYDAGTALTSVTGQAAGDTLTKTSHGLANGTVVILSALTGGTGLIAGRVYFVVGQTTNTFQVSTTSGGSAVDITVDYSSLTVTPYLEISGGSPAYARKSIAWSAATDPGNKTDSTNGAVIDVPANATVDAIGGFSASTAGTLLDFVVVTPSTDTAQFTYTVTDYSLDLNAATGTI